MKTNKIILIICDLIIFTSIVFCKSILIISHEDLFSTTWYNKYATLKSNTGYTVSHVEIGDGDGLGQIKFLIDDITPDFVLLIGDASAEPAEQRDLATSSNGNYIPFYYEMLYDPFHGPGLSAIATDDYLIKDSPNTYIGRIPANSAQEVDHWVDKLIEITQTYSSYQSWKNKVLFVTGNKDHPSNGCKGIYRSQERDSLLNYIQPFGMATTQLNSTDFSEPYGYSANKAGAFESAVNSGYGLINGISVGADWVHFMDFYWYDDCNWNFTNVGKYPFVLGISCSVGKVQQYDNGNVETIVQKLLFLDNAGIIGTIAPTWITGTWGVRQFYYKSFDKLIGNEYSSIGKSLKEIKTEFESENPNYEYMSRATLLFGDPSMSLPIYQYKNSNIISNTVWQGSIIVDNDITVSSGATLTIMPGTGVFIAPGKKIIVEGHISATGTSVYPIKFSGTGDLWHSIELRNSSHFSYCLFENGAWIYIKNQPSTFSHCVFKKPAIKTESNGTFNMSNCIVENGFCGMGITTGTSGISYLTNCTIRNNTSWGIKTSYDGRVVLNKTEVYDNGDGIVVGYHGILDLTPGRNAIINNNYNEININDQLTGIYPNNAYWYGDIYDNENPSPGYYIDNFYQTSQGENVYNHYASVKAEWVWWGTTNTTYISQRFSAPGYIDFSPIATSSQTAEFNIGAPETGLPLAKRVSSVPVVSLSPLNLDNSAPKVASSVLSAGIAKTVAADENDDEKEAKLSLKESIQAIKNQIRSEPYSESNPGRFLKLYSLLREDPEDNTGEYRSVIDIVSQYRTRSEDIHDQSLIKNEKNSKRKELYELEKLTGEVCMIIEVDDLIWKYKKYDEALALMQRLYPKVTTYDCRRELKMCEIAIYKFTEDWKKGLEAVQELKEEVKNTDLKDYTPPDYTDLENEFRMKLGLEPILAKEAPYFRKDKEEVLAMIPGEFALKHNYPNPFNPMTTIPFDLPEASRVQIHIYDLSGRQVALLTNGHYPAGSHQVIFNGSSLPSGMYIIRAQMKSDEPNKDAHHFTSKILLLK